MLVTRRVLPFLIVFAAEASTQGRDAQPSEPVAVPHYSRRQLAKLVREAKSMEQHKHLAAYYRMREREFRAKQTDQQKEIEAYRKGSPTHPSKYPTRADSAARLSWYYGAQADKAAAHAAEHERVVAELAGSNKD